MNVNSGSISSVFSPDKATLTIIQVKIVCPLSHTKTTWTEVKELTSMFINRVAVLNSEVRVSQKVDRCRPLISIWLIEVSGLSRRHHVLIVYLVPTAWIWVKKSIFHWNAQVWAICMKIRITFLVYTRNGTLNNVRWGLFNVDKKNYLDFKVNMCVGRWREHQNTTPLPSGPLHAQAPGYIFPLSNSLTIADTYVVFSSLKSHNISYLHARFTMQ